MSTTTKDPVHDRTPPQEGAGPSTVVLDGLRIHAVRERECVDHVMAAIDDGVGGWIATANLDHLRRLRRPSGFADAYGHATLVVADGMPLVWASRVQGTPLPERVAGSDLIYSLTDAAGARGRSVFLLGGNPGAAEQAAAVLSERAPGVRIAGTVCPPVGFEQSAEEMAGLEQRLRASGADIVFVALGSPKQELFIDRVREVLPSAWWIGIGISFSFVSGEVRRAPRWMQRVGLEWLHRLCQEPRRLCGRYLRHGLPSAAGLLARAAGRRLRRRR